MSISWDRRCHSTTAANEIIGSTPIELIAQSIGLFLFYFFLMRSAPNVSKMSACIHACIHALITATLVPQQLSFTYVQTALLSVAISHSLFKKDKDFFYDLTSSIIVVPVSLMSWFEAFVCDSFYKKIGGHVYYDATIPIAIFLYYVVALKYQPEEKRISSQKEK